MESRLREEELFRLPPSPIGPLPKAEAPAGLMDRLPGLYRSDSGVLRHLVEAAGSVLESVAIEARSKVGAGAGPGPAGPRDEAAAGTAAGLRALLGRECPGSVPEVWPGVTVRRTTVDGHSPPNGGAPVDGHSPPNGGAPVDGHGPPNGGAPVGGWLEVVRAEAPAAVVAWPAGSHPVPLPAGILPVLGRTVAVRLLSTPPHPAISGERFQGEILG